jgi:hypothetical protein
MPNEQSPSEVATPPETADLGLLGSAPIETPRDPATGRFIPQEAPVETPVEVPVKPQHPQHILDAAAYFGLADDDVAELPTQKLSDMLWKMKLRQDENRKQAALQRTIQDGQVRPLPPEVPPVEGELGLGDLEADLDPRMANLLKKLAKENKELRQSQGQLVEQEQRRTARSNAEIFDDGFEALGAPYEKFFGKGSGLEMQPNDPFRKRRMAILGAANLSSEDSPKMMQKKIKAAALEMYGPAVEVAPANDYNAIPSANGNGKPKAPAVKPKFTEEEYREGALEVPTNRGGGELPPGEEKALRNLAAKMGVAPTYTGDQEIRAGLLK